MIEAKFKTGVSLSRHTTFKIGGEAKYFLSVADRQELQEAIAWCQTHYVPFFILGGGSNVLVDDAGFDGLVIHLINNQINVFDKTIVAESGAILANLVRLANLNALSGLSWAAGIPGCVGGAVRGNAGAYGGDISANLHSVEYFDANTLSFKTMSATDCQFGYRDSIFKRNPAYVIWQAKFMLDLTDKDALIRESTKIIKERLSKLPLAPSAGCVFKNLIVNKLKNRTPLLDDIISRTTIKGGKIGCGVVIDNLKLKGQKCGGAMIAEDHANVIINADNASSAEVLALMEIIKSRAESELGLKLEEEIYYLK